MTRRQFGKWIVKGGILVPFVAPIIPRAATIIVRGPVIAAAAGGAPTWYDAIAPGSTDTTNPFNIYQQAQPVVAGQSGNCTKLRIRAAFGNSDAAKMALYDSSLNLLSNGLNSNVGAVSDAWCEVNITSQAVTNGLTYWIGSMCASTFQGRYLSGQPSGTSRIEFGGAYASFPPNPFPAGAWTVTQCVGMYIS